MHLGAIRAGLIHSTGSLPEKMARASGLGPSRAALGLLDNLKEAEGFAGQRLSFAPEKLEPLAEQIEQTSNVQRFEGLEAKAGRILRTSGTTGRPKTVLWDAEMISSRLEQIRDLGDASDVTRLFPLLGFPTTAGFRYPLAVWQAGGTVILAEFTSNAAGLLKLASDSNLMISSPFRLREFLRATSGEMRGKNERVLKLFGGRLPRLLRDEASRRVSEFVKISYGSTETGSIATGDASLVDRDPGAVGFVIPGAAVQIVGKDGVILEQGQTGLIRLKSSVMVDSYAGKANPTGSSSFRDGWFYPGDLGILYEDGMFAISGRVTETLNVDGAKFSAPDLEDKIRSVSGIADVCVLALPLDAQDLLTVAVVCSDEIDLKAMQSDILTLLPSFNRFALVRVPEIPRNAMGKIARAAITKRLTKATKARGEQSLLQNS